MRILTPIQTNRPDKGEEAEFGTKRLCEKVGERHDIRGTLRWATRVGTRHDPYEYAFPKHDHENAFPKQETPSRSRIRRVRLVPLNADQYKRGQAHPLHTGIRREAGPSSTASPPISLKKTLQNPWVKFGLRLGSTVLLFFLLFHSIAKSVSLSSLVSKLGTTDGGMLLIGMIVGLFCVIISACQWQCLLEGERIHIDLRKLTNLYFVGIAFNHFLPTGMGGDIVKAYYVGKEGQNVPGSASAVIMSRVTGFLGMLLVSIPTILIWHTIFVPSVIALFLLSCLTLCLALGGASLLVTFLPKMTSKWAVEKGIAPFPFLVPYLASFLKVGKTLRTSCTRPRFICKAVFFGTIFHLSAALNYYCYAKMLNVPVSINFYMLAIPFISLVSFLPISLNGYGLRESALVALFTTVHASASMVLLTALLIDVQALLFGVIGGLIYITMGQDRQTEQNTQTLLTIRTHKLPI